MKLLLPTFATLLTLLLPNTLFAADAPTQIKAVLSAQVAAWNRRDLPTFVGTYAENCIFVGKQITQGKAQLLTRYQKQYPTADAMGSLTFSDAEVHMLDSTVALVTAKWHLDRSSAGGGPVGGIFSLVFQRKNGIWKIALDHTS